MVGHSESSTDAVIEPTSEELLAEQVRVFNKMKGSTNFNRVAEDVYPVEVTKSKLVCEMVVQHQHLNSKGTLHGGQTATLTDVITARAVGVTVKDKGMASVELAVSYLLPVKVGDVLEITAHVLKVGRTMAFTDCEFRRKSDGKMSAKGKHTLAFLPNQPGISVENGTQF
ncbi:Putative esterase F42H10.6 [Caenorhabditis elegans]|uniref:Putative esterase F42H10.6 n=1 Tax=Caenorhabditis elegans TaxID=6239 RepID=YLZ6_CAEEL|nr:Putative esterase F42H10.6 [Caenorhabditis elegans]P34419.2 RecName: Full=Putative esterase F42H10.6 [Caenorhabditis elegans]CCD62884.1 Putative esterase F42H10.6 [Caenorhabditis elegans]|eukprot:NP_498872.1 Putative esterase F42H10.6 [Caenorhabditis elegans]